MDKKIKILTLSDHPFSPSGVGTQTKYIIEGMLATGKYQFLSLGGAIKHNDYRPQKTEQWGDNWVVVPVDGYGNQDMIRSIMRTEKPDIIWFMTDPRFWGWLWSIENEIRPNVPMVYYHVWDNYPYPTFNRKFYQSNDYVATISKVSDDIVRTVAPDVPTQYVPHAVDTDIFKKLPQEEILKFKKENLRIETGDDRPTFFWNNRNARRKQSGSVLWWFAEFLDKVGKDKARLVMHTDPKDVHGQDLHAIIKERGLLNREVLLSEQKVPPQSLAYFYNAADATINISDAEGFGLATLESLACETPIIVNKTGGLQEQVRNGDKLFGIEIEPSSRAVIGSQEVPFIYEDRISREQFVGALEQFVSMPKEHWSLIGKAGRQHVIDNYNFTNFINQWDEIFTEIHNKHGSWPNKAYKAWELKVL
jgi:glycosyltransferase involved in cell wall biosynthesis